MARIEYIDGIGIPHKSFEEEFLTHKKCSEWWYCTGYLQDDKGSLFAYQFTLAKITILGVKFHLLISSITDFRTRKHYNTQTPIFFSKGIITSSDLLSVDKQAVFSFTPNPLASKGRMDLHMVSDSFCLDVELEAVKAPVWHCDDGVLQMGILDDPKERTYYYSFTNLASKGKLVLLGEEFNNLSGKTWFDRQGGTYSLYNPRTNWEWFSLRFFDNTEAMLFAFPQDGYFDGTFIEANGKYRRLNDYKIQAQEVITFEGLKFSNGWDLEMNGKKFTLKPMIDGMFNLSFFELMADIIDERGKSVGYCFVELLPGVRNKNNPLDAFRRKK